MILTGSLKKKKEAFSVFVKLFLSLFCCCVFSIGFGTRHLSDIPELLDGRVLSVVEDYFGVLFFFCSLKVFSEVASELL